jgi:hypothetical protein
MHKAYNYINVFIITLFLILIFIKFNRNPEKYLNAFTLLCVIIIFVIIIKSILNKYEKYELQDDPKLIELKEIIKPLFDGTVRHDGLLEKINNIDLLGCKFKDSKNKPKALVSLYKDDDKSFTINKKEIYLCLKDENQEYYPDLQLIYVLLHELSHVLCDEVGHTDKFFKIFNQLIDKADEIGVYDKDFEVIIDYCKSNED